MNVKNNKHGNIVEVFDLDNIIVESATNKELVKLKERIENEIIERKREELMDSICYYIKGEKK